MFAVLFIVLNFTYGIKKSAQILTAPLCGALFAAAVSGELNLFNILALFLIPGFSIDYSIFRMNGGKKSKDAVFMSFASTAFSFLLLSFTGFKVISSLGFTLFCGITASYILSLFVIKSKHEK